MVKFKYKVSIFIVLFNIIAINSVLAEIYKWVDEEGNTHYTQSPPNNGAEAEIIKPRLEVDTDIANEALAEQQKKANELREERMESEDEKMKAEKDLAIREGNCKQAKESYASYKRPRVSVKNEDGSERIIGEEEREAEMMKAKKQVEEFCN